MTIPLPTPPNPTKGDAATVRKRRRRAPAGGAADDCFACSKRSVKCDRRRPYCSQCLEVGNECSGYKTQLTWGVGVASRGKLRGLSLPIAKAPPVNPVKKPTPSRSRTNSTVVATPTTTITQWHERADMSSERRRDDAELSQERHHAASVPPTPFHTFDLSQMSQAESMSQPAWASVSYSTGIPSEPSRFQKMVPNLVPVHGEHLSSSVDSLSEVDYMSPMSHSFTRDDIPFMHSPSIMYHEGLTGHNSPIPPSPASAIVIDQRAPTSCPGLVYGSAEPNSNLHSNVDIDSQLSHKILQECEPLATPDLDAYSTSAQSAGNFWGPSADEATSPTPLPDYVASSWPPLAEPQVMPVNPDIATKMPFFLDYYENTMCPSMVFIDGPSNPFRQNILQLAANSRSLQHAICALAACNLRMKRKLSLGQHGRDLSEKRLGEGAGSDQDAQPEDQSLSEEYQHRNLAVHLLNEQLNDAAKSRDDSVLATILLLCHYRMAESGIAKFHTQFAGVKKILSMRRSSPFPPSRDSAWMETLFTYFDAISASINERETQLNTSFYGVTPDAQLLSPGAENLVGCDRELFRTIIKLGRLNLLSQHRPVQNLVSPTAPRAVSSRSQSPLSPPLGHSYQPKHHHLNADIFTSQHHARFDGNGFVSTLNDEEIMSSAISSGAAYDDHRSIFWREWKDARIALQSWEYDAQRMIASLPGPTPATGAQIRDLGSLSEAFRYAALLFTERLASPGVPSTHNNFRNLVSQVVYYATSLEAGSSAEKFLLWPLFVSGSECVNELQQNIVRNKCRDIMARSGYMNNLAALEVLERLWAGDFREDTSPGGRVIRRGPFSWTKCIGGPGVEVEWIMF